MISENESKSFLFSEGLTSWTNSSLQVQFLCTSGGNTATLYYNMYQAICVLSQLDYIKDAIIKSKLKRKCRDIKNKLNAFGIQLSDHPVAKGNDPEYTQLALMDGVLLLRFVNAVTGFKMNRDLSLEENLPRKDRIDNLMEFVNFARNEVGIEAKDLFNPEDLFHSNLLALERVYDCILKVLGHDSLASSIKKDTEKIEKNHEMVLNELLNTEDAYITDLEQIVKSLYNVVQATQVATVQESKNIFGNIMQVYEFQKIFHASLRKTYETSPEQIGQAFIEHLSGFQNCYEIYCSNNSNSVAQIEQLKDSVAFIEVFQDPMWYVQWQSQLIKPVQRILKYHLLLRELVKYSSKQSQGFDLLETALTGMMKVAQNINEIKRNKEIQMELDDLIANLIDYDGVPIKHLGSLKQSGNIVWTVKKPVSCKAYLFSSTLILVKEVESKGKISYKYKSTLPVNTLEITNDSNLESIDFLKSDTQKTFNFGFRCAEEKDRWLQCLRTAISELPKREMKSITEKPTSEMKLSDKKGQRKGTMLNRVSSLAFRKTGDSGGRRFSVKNSLDEMMKQKHSISEIPEQFDETQMHESIKYNCRISSDLQTVTRDRLKLTEEYLNLSRKRMEMEKELSNYILSRTNWEQTIEQQKQLRQITTVRLNKELNVARDQNSKLRQILQTRRAYQDELRNQINAIGEQIGMGNVVPVSLASVMKNLKSKVTEEAK